MNSHIFNLLALQFGCLFFPVSEKEDLTSLNSCKTTQLLDPLSFSLAKVFRNLKNFHEKACKYPNAIYNGAKAVKGSSISAKAFKRALNGGRGQRKAERTCPGAGSAKLKRRADTRGNRVKGNECPYMHTGKKVAPRY